MERLPQHLNEAVHGISCGCHWGKVLRRIISECPALIKEFDGYLEKTEG